MSERCNCVKLLPVFVVDILLKHCSCTSGSHSCVFHSTAQRSFFFSLFKDMNVDICWTYERQLSVESFFSCFPGHLPVLGIVAVGSGLALIIFGISSFLIYRWVWLRRADASCLCCFLAQTVEMQILLFFYSQRRREKEKDVCLKQNLWVVLL